jgi:hypothetical protein
VVDATRNKIKEIKPTFVALLLGDFDVYKKIKERRE